MTRHLLLILLFASTWVRADASVDVLALIRARDFTSLEAHFSSVQSSFEKGSTDEYGLLDAYRPLYMQSDVISEELAAWTAKFPKSYFSHLARGTYYRKLGELNRGTKFSSQVPDSTMSYMEQVFDISEQELKTAMPLSRNPYLAALNLLNIARYRSDTEASDHYLAVGNKLLPGNMLIRARYLDHLKPRWGGSYEAMTAFVERSKAQGLDSANLGLLSAMIIDDQGLIAQTGGNLELAAEKYKLALSQAKNANPRLQADYLASATYVCRSGMLGDLQCP
jgi:tetratricopeptide (TPR) repeat protein